MACRRKHQDEVNRPCDLTRRCVLKGLALGMELADDLLETAEVRFDLDENDVRWAVEPKVD